MQRKVAGPDFEHVLTEGLEIGAGRLSNIEKTLTFSSSLEWVGVEEVQFVESVDIEIEEKVVDPEQSTERILKAVVSSEEETLPYGKGQLVRNVLVGFFVFTKLGVDGYFLACTVEKREKGNTGIPSGNEELFGSVMRLGKGGIKRLNNGETKLAIPVEAVRLAGPIQLPASVSVRRPEQWDWDDVRDVFDVPWEGFSNTW